MYNVLKKNRKNRNDEKIIKEKLAKILVKNPPEINFKNIEELYKEYKEFLYNEAKIKNTIEKLIPICEQ